MGGFSGDSRARQSSGQFGSSSDLELEHAARFETGVNFCMSGPSSFEDTISSSNRISRSASSSHLFLETKN